jgi:hypothetical protein
MLEKSQSIESQDLFVLSVLANKRNGTYLEIGARWPVQASNSHILEKHFGWRGVGVEWDPGYASQHAGSRTNVCVCADATTLDYDKILTEQNLGTHIDYLQLDIEPPEKTFAALKQIDLNKYKFSVITFEHEFSKNKTGVQVRDQSRELLKSFGYTLVIADACCEDEHSFEDWWVLEEAMPNDNWKDFVGSWVNVSKRDLDSSPINELFKKYVEV